MKKKVFVSLACVLIAAAALWLGLRPARPGPEAQLERLEALVTRALAAPDEGVSTALDLFFGPEDPASIDQEAYETAYTQALTDLLDNQATESMIRGMVLGGSVSGLHFEAVRDGFTVTPQEVTVTVNSADERIYDVTADVTVNGTGLTDAALTLTGRIQLDEEDRLRYFEVNYFPVTQAVAEARAELAAADLAAKTAFVEDVQVTGFHIEVIESSMGSTDTPCCGVALTVAYTTPAPKQAVDIGVGVEIPESWLHVFGHCGTVTQLYEFSPNDLIVPGPRQCIASLSCFASQDVLREDVTALLQDPANYPVVVVDGAGQQYRLCDVPVTLQL